VEQCETCPNCGKDKLYKNYEKGVFFCHVCQRGGRLEEGNRVPAVQADKNEQPLDYYGSDSAYNLILERVPILGPYRSRDMAMSWCKDPDGFAVPLRLGGKVVGLQSYNPALSPKYRTIGRRGVLILRCNSSESNKQLTKVLICEGIFDALQLLCWFSKRSERKEEARKENVVVVHTAGSHLTGEQAMEVYAEVKGDLRVLIAYDNDRQLPIVNAYTTLSLLRPVDRKVSIGYLIPPLDKGKDWDEVLKNGGVVE
jgi:hypothetical protein